MGATLNLIPRLPLLAKLTGHAFRTIAMFVVSLSHWPCQCASGQTPEKLKLAQNWKLAAAKDVSADGSSLSQSTYDDRKWFPIHRMPATVLEILQAVGAGVI